MCFVVVDEPLPDSINPALTRIKNDLYASIFYNYEADDVRPLAVFKTTYGNLQDQIKSASSSKGLGVYGLSVGIKRK